MQNFRSNSSILVKQKGNFLKIIILYFKKIELIRKKTHLGWWFSNVKKKMFNMAAQNPARQE